MRGRRLRCLKGRRVRPTLDRVKESVFGVLGEAVADSDTLDLFAGTGSLGIEALSRGAASVVFVESSRISVRMLEENLEQLDLGGRTRVLERDALRAVLTLERRGARFSLVFLDPPYRSGLAGLALERLAGSEIVRASGWVVAEHSREEELEQAPGRLERREARRYGGTVVSFYQACSRGGDSEQGG